LPFSLEGPVRTPSRLFMDAVGGWWLRGRYPGEWASSTNSLQERTLIGWLHAPALPVFPLLPFGRIRTKGPCGLKGEVGAGTTNRTQVMPPREGTASPEMPGVSAAEIAKVIGSAIGASAVRPSHALEWSFDLPDTGDRMPL